MRINLLSLAERVGEHVSPEIDITGARMIEVHLARCTSQMPDVWPAASRVELFCEIDEGAGWVAFGGFVASGGIYTTRHGAVLASNWLRPVSEAPDGDPRRMRVRLVFDEPTRTAVWAEVT